MTRLSPALLAALACCLLPAAASAQVSIEQVQQGSPQTNQGARNTDAFDQILATLQARSGASTFAAPAASFSPSAVSPTAGGVLANQAILNQFGQGNGGIITQNGTANIATAIVNGDRNRTTQTQTGDSNVSLLGISGNENVATITSNGAAGPGLPGSNNASGYFINGNNNVLTSTQSGSNLSYGLSIIGSGKSITVTQDGTGTQVNRGLVPLPTTGAAGISSAVAAGAAGR